MGENKNIVKQFNSAIIETKNIEIFNQLVVENFINHTTLPGSAKTREAFLAWGSADMLGAISQITSS